MANMNKIYNGLKHYLENEWNAKARKENPEYADLINSITPEQIYLGRSPTFQKGYVEGSSTAKGKSSNGDTVTTRTVSINFRTEEYYFITSSNTELAKSALRCFDYGSSCHTTAEAEHLANKYGKNECRNSLYDLDFSMDEYRLNRHRLIFSGDEFTLPYHPIYANVVEDGKEKIIHLGNYYVKNNTEYADWSIDIPLTAKKKMIIGGIIAAIVIIAIIIIAM